LLRERPVHIPFWGFACVCISVQRAQRASFRARARRTETPERTHLRPRRRVRTA
jgi:hypothetical protein